MTHPTWLSYGFAVVMVSVSFYCIGRLLIAKLWDRRNNYGANVSHVLMGLAMSGMLIPSWNLVSSRSWMVTFAVMACWFLVLGGRVLFTHGVNGTEQRTSHSHGNSHWLVHFLMACAMLYMYWMGMRAGSLSSDGMAMGSAAKAEPSYYLLLSFLFLISLLGSAIWQVDLIGRLSSPRLAVTGGATTSRELSNRWNACAWDSGAAAAERESSTLAIYGAQKRIRTGERTWLAPRLEIGCHVSMCIAMGYMLVQALLATK